MIIYLLIGSNAIYKINEKWHQHSLKDIIHSNLYLVTWSCLQIEPVQFFSSFLSMNHIVYFRTIHTRTEFRLESRYLLQIYEFVYCSISYMLLKWRCNCFGPSSVLTKNLNKTAFEPCNFWSQMKNHLQVCVRHEIIRIHFQCEKYRPENKKSGLNKILRI